MFYLTNYCKQNITSLSFLVGTTVAGASSYGVKLHIFIVCILPNHLLSYCVYRLFFIQIHTSTPFDAYDSHWSMRP